MPAVSPADSEHGDRYRRDLRSLREALDAERCAVEEFSAELERTGAAALARTEDAIERVRWAWDVGFQDAITRLDQIQAQVDEAVQRTRVLVGNISFGC